MLTHEIKDFIRDDIKIIGCAIDSVISSIDTREIISKLITWESHVVLNYLLFLREQEKQKEIEDSYGNTLDHIVELFTFKWLDEGVHESGIQSIDVGENGKLTVHYALERNEEYPLYRILNDESYDENPFIKFRNNKNEISLDYILSHFPPFKNLNENIKKRIVSNEFINQYIKRQTITDENLNLIRESVVDAKQYRLKEELDNAQRRIEEYMENVKNLSQKYNELLLHYNGIESTNIDVDKLSKVIKDPRIANIRLNKKNRSLDILTQPIYLSYDVDKKDTHRATKKLKNNEKLCIGVHLIRIELDNLNIIFRHLTEDYRNYHVEQYSCYGNFADPLNKARLSYDLPRTISLALQMISHATIGDPAGNETLNKAFVVSANEGVQMDSNAEEHVLSFIESRMNDNHSIYIERGR